jgi:hypothetical protein
MKRIVLAATAAALAVPAVAAGVAQAGPDATGNKARIANATSAAPAAVSRTATVLDYGKAATDPFVVLRKGSGRWTCFPDHLDSPGNDPYCYDRNGMRWLEAYYAGKKPQLTGPGVIYRLQGGTDPSLTDPAAVVPAKGEKWTFHGPHIVLLSPDRLKPADYGAVNAGAHGDHAWVMWPGTPYEHLHLPVGDHH